jgi:serine/threonine protein kinase
MQALPIMQQLCSAVQYAHENDVIHGNIKPTNIFVAADGRILLSDFGIVRGYDDTQQSLTRIGWGSAEYAAPEQSLGILRRASDIYSMGVLLFRILTGEPPFTGQTPVEVLLKHVRQEAPSARSLDAHISDAVDGVLHMALQKRSDDRFASAEEFSNALAVAVSVAPVAPPVAKAVSPIAHQSVPEYGLASTNDPQTPEPTYSTMTSFNESADRGSYIFWSTEPVEWSPIGEEVGDSISATATDYLNSKDTLSENGIAESTSVLTSELEIERGSNEKVAHSSFFQKLLPILVVILLVIVLIAALLSSFIIPNSSSSSNTGRNHQIIVVLSTTGEQSH